jgi:hypothetical protein
MLSRQPADRAYRAEPPMLNWMLLIAAAVASIVFVLAIILAVQLEPGSQDPQPKNEQR